MAPRARTRARAGKLRGFRHLGWHSHLAWRVLNRRGGCTVAAAPLVDTWRSCMLRYAAIFFVIALIAALFGFGGIAAGAVEIAKVLFFIFVILFLVSLVWGLIAGNRSP